MLEKQLEYIRSVTDFRPDIAIVLGSGLGGLADEIDAEKSLITVTFLIFPYRLRRVIKADLYLEHLAAKRLRQCRAAFIFTRVILPLRQ